MGILISVEGGEFTGKTTLVEGLFKIFKLKGVNVYCGREPGTTKKGEEIRLLVNKTSKYKTSFELARLFFESRDHLVKELLIPHLGENKEKDALVILDRYIDSTRVYQGFEGGLDLSIIGSLEKKYLSGFYPDLTIILFFPEGKFPDTMRRRMKDALHSRDISLWEAMSLEVQLKRQQFFLKLVSLSKKWGETRQFLLIDATAGKERVLKKAFSAVDNLIADSKYGVTGH